MISKFLIIAAAAVFTASVASTSQATVRGCDYPRTKCVS